MGSFALASVSLILASSSARAAKTITVQTPGPGFSTHLADCASIQLALADPTLAAGDTIEVWESFYSQAVSEGWIPEDGQNDPLISTYDENIVFPAFYSVIQAAPVFAGEGKVIEIHGTGFNSVVVFASSANTRASVLDGFTLTGGKGTVDPYLGGIGESGGGIFCSGATPTIRNCTISQNTARLGGGIYASLGDADNNHLMGLLVENCTIEGNQALLDSLGMSASGGGLFAIHCSPEIRN